MSPKAKPVKVVGRRSRHPMVTGKKTQTRMVRVHVEFANWLVKEAEKESQQYGRTVTIVEITQSLHRRLSE